MDDFIQKIKSCIATRRLLKIPPEQQPTPVVVALSGGADSVALLIGLSTLGYRCVAAHCNFHLRGEESDRDMRHASAIAGEYASDFRIIHFDVPAYKKRHGVSTEMACRDLRYNWFRQLSEELQGAPVAIAHHRDDNEETFFLNLLRGTGLTGLRGMKPRNGLFIRPMLEITRREIEQFLTRNGIEYVTDSTNLETDVKRNRLRNIILPMMRQQFPEADAGIVHTMSDLSRNLALYEESTALLLERYIDSDGNIAVARMSREIRSADTLLFEHIRHLGFTFTQAADIISASGNSGRRFIAPQHVAILDRGTLIISPNTPDEIPVRTFSLDSTISGLPEHLSAEIINREDMRPDRSGMTLFLDASILTGNPEFTLRGWRDGDRIHPFGMQGSRLLSDIMSDAKLPLNAKHRVEILETGGRILWAIGLRTSCHYPITTETREILRITCSRKLW